MRAPSTLRLSSSTLRAQGVKYDTHQHSECDPDRRRRSYGSLSPDPYAIAHGIAGIHDDPVAVYHAGFDHGFYRVATA